MTEQLYLNERELAARLNLSVKTLQKLRLEGGGIAFAKFGRAVRYPIAKIRAFEEASLRNSTSDPGPDGRVDDT